MSCILFASSVSRVAVIVLFALIATGCSPRSTQKGAGPAAPPAVKPGCSRVVTLDGAEEHYSLAVESNGQTVSLESELQSQSGRINQVIRIGDHIVMEARVRVEGGRAQVEIRQRLEPHAPELTLTTHDGDWFEGAVDGRPLRRFDKRSPLRELALADGSALPDYKPGPEVEVALAALFEAAHEQTDKCLDRVAEGGMFGTLQSALTSGPGVARLTHSSAGCVACRAAAITDGAACVWGGSKACAGIAAACTLWYGVCYGVCLGAAVAVCLVAQYATLNACWSGGACCPVACPGGMGGSCCEGGGYLPRSRTRRVLPARVEPMRHGRVLRTGQYVHGRSDVLPERGL